MHRIVNDRAAAARAPEVPHALGEMILDKLLAKDPAIATSR